MVNREEDIPMSRFINQEEMVRRSSEESEEDERNMFDEDWENYFPEIKIEREKQLLNKRYFIPEIFKESIKKEKESVFLYGENIDDEILKKQKQELKNVYKLKSVKTVNMMKNKITDMSLVVNLFPNAETLLLSNCYSLFRQ